MKERLQLKSNNNTTIPDRLNCNDPRQLRHSELHHTVEGIEHIPGFQMWKQSLLDKASETVIVGKSKYPALISYHGGECAPAMHNLVKQTHKHPLRLPPLSGADLVTNAWSEEEIACYGIAGPPRKLRMGPYIAHLFDMRMRRWYSITADHYEPDLNDPEWNELEDPYWCDVLRRTGHRGRDDFNHVEVNKADGSLSFSLVPDNALPGLRLHPPPKEPVPGYPHVLYTALQDRKYLEYSVETCTWEGKRCVFKQPLMNGQVTMLDKEISIIKRLAHSPHIVHFIAYVVDEDGDLRGILLPWAGVQLDTLHTVRWSFFRDILYGLLDIHALTVQKSEDGKEEEASHGDLFCRNILVKDDVARLIDLDNEGLDYPGDHEAFLNVLLALKDKAEGDIDVRRIGELEAWLRAGMGFAQLGENMKGW